MSTLLSREHVIAHLVLAGIGTMGTAALFLPFTYGVSPLEAAFDGDVWRLALPFFLSPAASAGSMRWVVLGSLSRVERATAYTLSAASAALTLSGYFMYAGGSVEWPSGIQEWLSFVVPLLTLVLGCGLLLRNSRTALSKAFNPVLAIHVAYLANGVLCLIGFLGEWQVGAYFVLVAASTFLVQMGLVSTQRSRALV